VQCVLQRGAREIVLRHERVAVSVVSVPMRRHFFVLFVCVFKGELSLIVRRMMVKMFCSEEREKSSAIFHEREAVSVVPIA
jgi:hypothetical protein